MYYYPAPPNHFSRFTNESMLFIQNFNQTTGLYLRVLSFLKKKLCGIYWQRFGQISENFIIVHNIKMVDNMHWDMFCIPVPLKATKPNNVPIMQF